MNVQTEVTQILDDTLGLGGRSRGFTATTALLGALPELDSMAVLNLITALEDRLGVSLADADISADNFATVGSLTALVSEKLRDAA